MYRIYTQSDVFDEVIFFDTWEIDKSFLKCITYNKGLFIIRLSTINFIEQIKPS